MKPMPDRERHPRERGAIAAFTGIILMTLVGMTVVGVDLGRLAFTATEVQTVAEVAATGYAHAWLKGEAAGTSPSDGTCASEALGVIDGNSIDGQAAASANIEGYERGFFDFDTHGPFVPGGGETANAVRATATGTVNNFFGALFGTPETTVRKTAVASLTCGSRAQTLPLLVQDCEFGGFDGPEDCAELPTITQQNIHVENSCWTSLSSSDSANANDIGDMIEQQCCDAGPGNCVLSSTYPTISEGQDVLVMNGQANMLQAMRTCWDRGFKEFIVPITPCGSPCNQSNNVSGFARIVLSERPVAVGNPKYISISAFCNTDPTEGVGGNCDFGNFKVAMVE